MTSLPLLTRDAARSSRTLLGRRETSLSTVGLEAVRALYEPAFAEVSDGRDRGITGADAVGFLERKGQPLARSRSRNRERRAMRPAAYSALPSLPWQRDV